MKSTHHGEKVYAIELDQDGRYFRFALTFDEFAANWPELYDSVKDKLPMHTLDSADLRPFGFLLFCLCIVGDRYWKKFFSQLDSGLPMDDIEKGNIATIDYDKCGVLKDDVLFYVEAK